MFMLRLKFFLKRPNFWVIGTTCWLIARNFQISHKEKLQNFVGEFFRVGYVDKDEEGNAPFLCAWTSEQTCTLHSRLGARETAVKIAQIRLINKRRSLCDD